MPSTKPRFTVRTEQEVLDKIGYIAEQNERTTTQEIVFLIKQRIAQYEQEHGRIEIPEYMRLTGDRNSLLHERHTENPN